MNLTPRIKCSLDELNSTRGSTIIKLLSGIANKGKGISYFNRSFGGRYFIIGVSDVFESGSEFTNWRFRTYVPDFHAMYHERWLRLDDDQYFLDRAYLHIYKTKHSQLEEEEYILLHCDISEPDDAEHSIYKQSPHLHIQSAEDPLPHAHIALNNCDLADIISSLNKLDVALENAIKMIDNQILFQLVK